MNPDEYISGCLGVEKEDRIKNEINLLTVELTKVLPDGFHVETETYTETYGTMSDLNPTKYTVLKVVSDEIIKYADKKIYTFWNYLFKRVKKVNKIHARLAISQDYEEGWELSKGDVDIFDEELADELEQFGKGNGFRNTIILGYRDIPCKGCGNERPHLSDLDRGDWSECLYCGEYSFNTV